MTDQPIVLDDVKRLDVRPGDVLLVRFKQYLSDMEFDEVNTYLSEALGDDVRVVVVEGDAEVMVARPEPA